MINLKSLYFKHSMNWIPKVILVPFFLHFHVCVWSEMPSYHPNQKMSEKAEFVENIHIINIINKTLRAPPTHGN